MAYKIPISRSVFPDKAHAPMLLTSFVLALLVIYILVFHLGFYFETNDDLAFAWMMQGRDIVPPQLDFYQFFRGGTSYLLVYLISIFGPSAYGWLLTTGVILACWRWSYIVLTQSSALADKYWLVSQLAVFTLLAITVFQPLNFTRVAYFLAFVGAAQIAFFAYEREIGIGKLIDFGLLFIGFAIRPQAGLLAIGLVVLIALLLNWQRGIRFLVFAGIFVAAFTIGDKLSTSAEEKEYLERNQYGVLIFDHREKPVDFNDKTTRFRLQMIRNWFLFDESIYNSEFLKTHIFPRVQTVKESIQLGLQKLPTLGVMWWTFGGFWWWGLMLILLSMQLIEKRSTEWRRFLMVLLGSLAIVLSVHLLYGLKPRVIEPFLGSVLIAAWFRFARSGGDSRIRILLSASVLVCVASLATSIYLKRDNVAILDAREKRVRLLVDSIEKNLYDKYVFTMLGDPMESLWTHNSPLNTFFPSARIHIIPMQGWITQFPDFQELLDEMGNGRSIRGVVEEMQRTPDDYLMMGDEYSVTLFLSYLNSEYDARFGKEKHSVAHLTYYKLVSD